MVESVSSLQSRELIFKNSYLHSVDKKKMTI